MIEGGDGDQLQTTECPSYVLDHISTDDSVTTFSIDRGVRRLGEFADVGTTLLSEGTLLRGPAVLCLIASHR